ncbi:MAG: hypothetical protein WA268_15685 [Xanthobacteraceae bacterium]
MLFVVHALDKKDILPTRAKHYRGLKVSTVPLWREAFFPGFFRRHALKFRHDDN